MSTRDSYVKNAEKEFAEVQAQLAALAKTAKKAVTAAEKEGSRIVTAAQSRHDEALHRFELLKRAGEESWDSVKTSFESAWTDLRHALGAKA